MDTQTVTDQIDISHDERFILLTCHDEVHVWDGKIYLPDELKQFIGRARESISAAERDWSALLTSIQNAH